MLNLASNFTRREESFPIPLKYIDVPRTAHTNFDVMQESRIDDCWNIDGSRDLSGSWKSFTKFPLLSEKPPVGFLTRKQPTSKPDHSWQQLRDKMGKNAKLKLKWSHEKLHLENARKLRGIYSSTLRTKNLRRPSRMLARNWKRLLLFPAKLSRAIRIAGVVHQQN